MARCRECELAAARTLTGPGSIELEAADMSLDRTKLLVTGLAFVQDDPPVRIDPPVRP